MDKETKLKILKIVLETMLSQKDIYRGICYYIEVLAWQKDLDLLELKEFRFWFNKQKPRRNLHSKFFKGDFFTNGSWWWVRDERGFKIRIEFLEYLIERESK